MFPLPIPYIQIQNDVKVFDFEFFKSTRVHPDSDHKLQLALARLYQDCPTFRVMISDFSKEQSNISLLLTTTVKRTFGTVQIDKTPNGYLITVFTQTKLANAGFDSIEPWLGSILFALLEFTRRDGVQKISPNRYLFDDKIEASMWFFQQKIRDELKKSKTIPKLKIADNGKVLYNVTILKSRIDGSPW